MYKKILRIIDRPYGDLGNHYRLEGFERGFSSIFKVVPISGGIQTCELDVKVFDIRNDTHEHMPLHVS